MPTAKLGKFTVNFDNSEEYHRLKTEIFTHDQYYFETDNPQPVIIDAGAHIGLATLYFKKLYPGAQITAIEPQAANFKLLQLNVWTNNLQDVTIHPVALSDKTGHTTFFQDATDDHWYSTAGFTPGAWNGGQTSQEILVPTQPLSDFLTQPIDFLKLDIEGAESHVLQAATPHLHLVKEMMIEFHPSPHHSFKRLTELLEKNGFELEFWQKQKLITHYEKGLAMIHASRP